MSQIVKIECSECESVDTYEMDGCILIGWRKAGLFYRAHELTLGEAIKTLIDKLVEDAEDEN